MNNPSELKPFLVIKNCLIVITLLMVVSLAIDIYWIYDHKGREEWKAPHHDNVSQLLALQQYDAALAFSEGVLESSPTDPSALWGKAASLYYLERWEEAKATFLLVMEARPDWSEYAGHYVRVIQSKLDEKK